MPKIVIWASPACGGYKSASQSTSRRKFLNAAIAGSPARILNGAKPGDLPVQQPTIFIFVTNLKSAKALGINEIPNNILIFANEFIE
jgi:putative ABC transport system substrate-binding protein